MWEEGRCLSLHLNVWSHKPDYKLNDFLFYYYVKTLKTFDLLVMNVIYIEITVILSFMYRYITVFAYFISAENFWVGVI